MAARRGDRGRLLLPILVAIVFVAGAATMLYPSTAMWFHQQRESEQIARYSGEVLQLPREGVDDLLASARAYNAELVDGRATVGANQNVPSAVGDPSAVADYRDQLADSPSGVMARLKIPTINADLPIYHGTSDATLLRGVGHLEGTALPIGGTSMHSVLTAHRGLADAELFTRLDEVEVGDTFVIEVLDEVLTYQVISTRVVDPEDTESLYPVAGEDLVTLVTCTPLGINTQRILVTGERITPTPIGDIEAAGQRPQVPGFPWWAVIFAGVVVLAAAFVWFMRTPRRARDDAQTDSAAAEALEVSEP